ncbi:MAG: ABC transporter permease [Clostridia bacterium]|nr:ABC transporter permease [Clostridia bacterium]
MGYFKFLKESTLDIFRNMRRIWSLAVFEYKRANTDMFLGGLWKFLSPLLQIGVYWVVFGIGLRNNSDMNGFPFVLWLTCGLTPWLMMNQGVNTGAASVFRKAGLLTKSNLKMSMIPVSSVLSAILNQIWTVLILFAIFLLTGGRIWWTCLDLIYYVVFMFVFVSALSQVTAAFVVLARDFQKVVQNAMRFLFFLSPIFWEANPNMPYVFQVFDKLNPFAYVIRGFRNAMLYHVPFWHEMKLVCAFWLAAIILHMIGIALQMRLRNNVLDYV